MGLLEPADATRKESIVVTPDPDGTVKVTYKREDVFSEMTVVRRESGERFRVLKHVDGRIKGMPWQTEQLEAALLTEEVAMPVLVLIAKSATDTTSTPMAFNAQESGMYLPADIDEEDQVALKGLMTILNDARNANVPSVLLLPPSIIPYYKSDEED